FDERFIPHDSSSSYIPSSSSSHLEDPFFEEVIDVIEDPIPTNVVTMPKWAHTTIFE
ncbi:hypothetical protein KI387_043809, partial [Taxus chinensis]